MRNPKKPQRHTATEVAAWDWGLASNLESKLVNGYLVAEYLVTGYMVTPSFQMTISW